MGGKKENRLTAVRNKEKKRGRGEVRPNLKCVEAWGKARAVAHGGIGVSDTKLCTC